VATTVRNTWLHMQIHILRIYANYLASVA